MQTLCWLAVRIVVTVQFHVLAQASKGFSLLGTSILSDSACPLVVIRQCLFQILLTARWGQNEFSHLVCNRHVLHAVTEKHLTIQV